MVAERESGQRLDVVLARALDVSRAEARRTLARGVVRLAGRALGLRDKGRSVASGARIEVTTFTPPPARLPLPDAQAELKLLASGDGWLAFDKAAGVPTHPLAEAETGTLLNAAVARYPKLLGVGEGGLRSGVVHRLDLETTGVMLFATTPARFAELRRAFRRHRVVKRYRAIVQGQLRGEGELAFQLMVAQHRPSRVRVVCEGEAGFGTRTRLARTHWRALTRFDDATLLEVHPQGGFLHQIRASLAHLGHPLLGDARYGAAARSDVRRTMLHAAQIHYADITATAPDASDFVATLDWLRQRG